MLLPSTSARIFFILKGEITPVKNPGCFGLCRFGQFWGWVVSALVVGSFLPVLRVGLFGPESFRPKYMKTNQIICNTSNIN